MRYLGVALIAGGLLVAAMLDLARSTRYRSRVMGISAVCGAVVGVLFYSYAYTRAEGFSAEAVLRTLMTVCRMFGGVNDAAALSGTPLFSHRLLVALFWLGHFLAFYVTASAAIELLGRRLLKGLRIRLLSRGALCVVYGAGADTLALVKRRPGRQALVLVSDREDTGLGAIADAMGGVLFTGGAAVCATEAFLKRVGVNSGRRVIDLYALGPSPLENLRFAEAFCRAMEARGVAPEATSAFLLGVSEEKAAHLQALEGRYGFGALMASETHALMARLMVQKLPPWTLMSFDDAGRAAGDFRVVIAGFGRMGRAALTQMVMNGQMAGSAFHADVFDPDMDRLSGCMNACFPDLLRAFDIRLRPEAAGSDAFYRCLAETPPTVILLCTGSAEANADLAADLDRLYAVQPSRPPVLQCTGEALRLGDAEHRLSGVDVRGIDRRAMIVNHMYCGGPSPEADWRACDPFSRASSRASADFCPAFLRAAGVDRAAALNQWPPRAEVLENLARTEHLRWCAFHLAMGYRPMSDAEFEARARRFRQGEDIRVSKNAEARTHACLVPWENLDALSQRENRLGGRQVDYKAMDVNNVLALPEILKAEDEG